MLLNEITCNLFYTSDQSAAGVKETKVRTQIFSETDVLPFSMCLTQCVVYMYMHNTFNYVR